MSAGVTAAPVRSPDDLLRELGLSARALFEVYVLGRRDADRERLAERVEVLAGPGDPVEGGLHGGDVLVRGAMGEPVALAAVLVDGHLHDRAALDGLDLEPEGRLPGRYAWVIEGGAQPHSQDDRFARRISDRRGFLPHDEALLRVGAGSAPAPSPTPAPVPVVEALEEAVDRQSRDYIRWYQDALNRIDNANLDVDGILGPLTRAAVRRYQTRRGIGVDGIVGPVTERTLMLDGAATPPGFSGPPVTPPTVTFGLLVDGDRDGTVDAAPGTSSSWTWGPGGHGAVILVNNDDDGVNGTPDNEDSTVDAGNDRSDLAALCILPPRTAVPAGTTLDLIVDRPDAIRIFAARSAGSPEVVGPATGGTHRFATLPSSRLDLAMEGIRYAGTGFDGTITIRLRTTSPAGVQTEHTAVVRVAPWIMPNHLTHGERVYVVNVGPSNLRFRTELRPMVTAAGATLVEFTSGDRWMQDCMEFGFASIPGVSLRTVMRAPRDRALQTFPRTLLTTDIGYVEEGVPSDVTFNSTGNLEATPPFTAPSGKRFPFGRIYFGPGAGLDTVDADEVAFLRAQIVQQPIELDTSWLLVGHVDEVLSFVPAPGSPGFKMLIASPRRAYAILDALHASNPTARMLVGREFRRRLAAGVVNVEKTVDEFLALSDDFHPDLRAGVLAGTVTHTARPLRDYNTDRQANINAIRTTMVTELGLRDADIVEIPAIFMPNPSQPDFADAMVPGMVNMLVVNRHCVVPQPFGPRVGSPPADRFEQEVRTQLTALGLHVHFIDCWDEYHVLLGEVHCATNTLRRAAPVRWWEFQP
ncbi:MAG: protein-arginine deiminase family protein [Gaiellaceae bacterium]